jgi:putative membrane protein
MEMRWLMAALHLLALGIGLGGIWVRGRALLGDLDEATLQRILYADTFWGIAALLWIGTGLARLLGGMEKGTAYYLQNDLFLLKMGLLGLILVLEIWPMVNLIRWRVAKMRKLTPDLRGARMMGQISMVQVVVVVVMIFAATAMARGYGV